MTDPIHLADHDWLSSPADTPANARFEGLIDPSGVVKEPVMTRRGRSK